MQVYAEHLPSCAGLQDDLSRLAKGLGRHWEISVDHVERVKWYAPHIRHVVLDVRCSATSAPADSTAAHAHLASQAPGDSQSKVPRSFTRSCPLTGCTTPHPYIPVLFASQVTVDLIRSRHSSGSCTRCAAESDLCKGTEEWFWREAAPCMEPVVLNGCDWGPASER